MAKSYVVEGEHDTAYLPSNENMQNMDEVTLQKFIDADNKDKE